MLQTHRQQRVWGNVTSEGAGGRMKMGRKNLVAVWRMFVYFGALKTVNAMVENKMYLISESVFRYTSERTSLYFRLRYEYKLNLLLQCQVWPVGLYYKIQSYPP